MLQAALSQYDEREVHAPKMEILDPGNELLQDLVDNFGQLRSQPYRAEVACFFELKPSDIGALVGAQRKMVRMLRHMLLWITLQKSLGGLKVEHLLLTLDTRDS